MKKIIALVFAFVMMVSSLAMADATRDNALGNPMMNVDDTAVQARYPSTLQLFPNAISALFVNGAGEFYNILKVAYKANDMLGIAITYDENEVAWGNVFWTKANPYTVGVPLFYSYSRVATFTYGMKAGTMLAGASAKVYFYDNENHTVTSIDSNEEAYQWVKFKGVNVDLNPSIKLEMGEMNLYATLNTSLKGMGYSFMRTNDKRTMAVTASLLQTIGIKALMTKNLSDTALAGVEIGFKMMNDGYKSQVVTNGKDVYADTNSIYINNEMEASLGFGIRVQATEQALLFAELGTMLNINEDGHYKDADKKTYWISTTWTVPSIKVGAEFEIVKDLKFRIAAAPSYQIQIDERASYKGNAGSKWVYDNGFGIAKSMGLGYKAGSFSINWELNSDSMENVFTQPLKFININGTAGAQNDLFNTVQISYTF